GNPYIITMDMNADNKCRDGFYRTLGVSQQDKATGYNGLYNGTDANGGGDHFEASTTVMAWSLGPDGKLNSAIKANVAPNKDNVLTWK
ncbi:MAG: Type secretion system protein, partial [Pedosphaera sp.]|nr:Type secretion system protein [Pedosphaera sp.]